MCVDGDSAPYLSVSVRDSDKIGPWATSRREFGTLSAEFLLLFLLFFLLLVLSIPALSFLVTALLAPPFFFFRSFIVRAGFFATAVPYQRPVTSESLLVALPTSPFLRFSSFSVCVEFV